MVAAGSAAHVAGVRSVVFMMDSRDESLPMLPTKHMFTIFGPTPPISQRDIMRSDDFREDGDLCEEDEEDEEDGERGEKVKEEGNASWDTGAAVGSRLGPLEAIVEEESGDEKDREARSIDSSLAERLELGYFDTPLTQKSTPLEKLTAESLNPPQIVTDLDTDHFGRPRTAERPTTPLPEKREQKRLEPSPFMRSSSSACIDCIASGNNHHHERTTVQSPSPSWPSPVSESLALSLKDIVETSSEPTLARRHSTNLTTQARDKRRTPPKSTVHHRTGSSNFSTPPRLTDESPASTAEKIATFPIREFTPPRESSRIEVPTPPRESASNPHEHPHDRRLLNPTTPAREQAFAILPTPPTTPARRKSLPADPSAIRKTYQNLPEPVREERPTTSSGIIDETRSGNDHDDHKCPFSSRDRNPREMRHSKSYSFQSRPSTPESGQRLSHSYSASDISRISNRVSSSPEPSRLSAYNAYSRPTTPELSRLSYTYTHSRPGSSDGSRLAYPYSRPTTPEVVFAGTGTRAPFVDVSEPVSRMPSPPPPTIASSVGTSPASSMLLQPPIDFTRDSAVRPKPRGMGRAISTEDLSAADHFFRSVLGGTRYAEQESPEEKLTPELGAAEPEVPEAEIPEAEIPKTESPVEIPEVKVVESPVPVIHQNFITVFVIPRATKYYLQGPRFWNISISLVLAFLILGVLVTLSTGFVYLFTDGTTSRGLPDAFFGEGKLLEDLSPLIAIMSYLGIFVWVTIFSRRAISSHSKGTEKPGLLVEFFGQRRAAPIKKLLSPRKLKVFLLLFLIAVGTTGLYLGAKIVAPVATAAVNKGVAAGVNYWNTIHAPVVEIPASTEVQMGMPEVWDEMDFIYFQPDEKAGEDEKFVSHMEGSHGTYYPNSEDKGYHGDEDELGWGAVIRLGLALAIGPAGAMAWRHRRNM